MPKTKRQRHHCVSRKVKTEFGSMYIHLDLDERAHPIGGSISTPMKEPDSEITRLIHTLSEGLDHALKGIGGEDED